MGGRAIDPVSFGHSIGVAEEVPVLLWVCGHACVPTTQYGTHLGNTLGPCAQPGLVTH